jgi:tRNA 5-methylaminomethyl-2-thiouridine biosynthesis bifunctional protein
MNPEPAPREPVAWCDRDGPFSARFQQAYRSRSGALAQAATVYLGGCGLPERWRGRTHFTVLETGFGLGLNFLATWAAWQADPLRSASLSFLSVEAYPVAPGDIVRSAEQACAALTQGEGVFGQVPAMARALPRVWRGLVPGVQAWEFAGGRVQLTVAVGDVLPMLQAVPPGAGAVYLDGFSPAVNPEMWTEQVLQAVAGRCLPGARLASYSTARALRATLERRGFAVQRCQGLPPKRHRLQAVFSGAPATAGAGAF